jgi:hypothetical protein
MKNAVSMRVGALFALLSFAASTYADDRDRIIEDIVINTGASRATAGQVINAIIEFMHDLQNRISYIARHQTLLGRPKMRPRRTRSSSASSAIVQKFKSHPPRREECVRDQSASTSMIWRG